jgi:16S rRNA (cytidine1402-2'-O)-methyltransferase
VEDLKKTTFGTLAVYESPHRLRETLEMFAILFGDQPIVLAKELTKTFECIRKAPASAHLAWLEEDSKRCQGEFVLLFENEPTQTNALSLSLEDLLTVLLKHVSLKATVAEAVALSGLPKNKVYEQALALKMSKQGGIKGE